MTSRVRASILAITFAAFIAIPAIASAQEPVRVGVKAGVNFAKIDGDDQDDAKNKTGLVAGLFLTKAVNANVGVRTELNFSQQGAKFEEDGEDGSINLTYVNVPLLLTFAPSSSGATRFNVFTGPQIGFNTKAELESGDITLDFDDQVKGNDFSWVIGAGLENGRFSGDVRYALGLSSIAEDGDSVKNRVFSVNFGVRLK